MSKKSGGSFQDSLNDWLVSIIIAVALAFLIRTFILEPYMVSGTSMYPTLVNNERLIVNKLVYFIRDPRRDEIIVFRYPKDESRDFIKRVIAVGGDTVEMRDGAVLVNGKKIDEPYTWKEDPKGLNHSNYRKSVVPKDTILSWVTTATIRKTAASPMWTSSRCPLSRARPPSPSGPWKSANPAVIGRSTAPSGGKGKEDCHGPEGF